MSNHKVLIVEDDADVRLGYHVLLKAHHYDTFFAADSVTAVSEARKHQPDLIILDLGLPAGDGFIVLERYRFERLSLRHPGHRGVRPRSVRQQGSRAAGGGQGVLAETLERSRAADDDQPPARSPRAACLGTHVNGRRRCGCGTSHARRDPNTLGELRRRRAWRPS